MGEAAWVIFAIRRPLGFTEQQHRCRYFDITMHDRPVSADIRIRQ
jgi:hypothetical protein